MGKTKHINKKRPIDPITLRKTQKKTAKLLKRTNRELKRTNPDLQKVIRLQKKTAKLLSYVADGIGSAERFHPSRSSDEHEERQTYQDLHNASSPEVTAQENNQTNNLSYELKLVSEKHVQKYGAHACAYTSKVSHVNRSDNLLKDCMNALDNLFEKAISEVKEKCKLDNPTRDRMRVMVTSSELKKPLSSRLVSVKEQSPSLILSEIAKVLQSDEGLRLDESFTIDIVALKSPTGRGKSYKVLNYRKHTKLKKSIITIRNKDHLCAARAIVTGKAMALNDHRARRIKHARPIQRRLALELELHEEAGVPVGPCGLEEIQKFQQVLPNFQIKVISFPSNNSIIFEGKESDNQIILYFNEGHFDLINPKKLPAFFGKRFHCNTCNKYYNDAKRHPCNDVCRVCEHRTCVRSLASVECKDCNKFCRSQGCFDAHKKDRTKNGKKFRSKCEKSFRCKRCNSTVASERKFQHRCGEYRCPICKDMVLLDHKCFMQTQDPKQPSERLLFFDFETDQSSNEHVVNFAVSQNFQGETFVFEGYDALDEFCNFLFEENHKDYTAIAHNAKSFDSIFVLRWLLRNRPTADLSIIRNGQKIMQLLVRDYNIRIIDSINWFGMGLDKLAKTFGLNTSEFSKGTFPHLFNRAENFEYVGPIPDSKYYAPDSLLREKRERLIAWHNSMRESGYVFDFKREILKYCEQDVNILRESCLRFRSIFLEETETDPFQYVTIAATVMGIYRHKFLKPNTIAIVPKHLYRGINKLYSKDSIQWLEFVAYITKTEIEHAENSGEHVIHDDEHGKKYFVDGYDPINKIVYEYYGCVFHSHNKCCDPTSPNPFRSNVNNLDIYEQTLKREQRLRQLGYEVRFIWECDFKTLTSQSHAFRHFISTHELVGNLYPKDSFFGGRTNGFKLFYSCTSGEKIRYADVTSLYPFVQKTKKYPVSHPVILTKDFENIESYFGLVKCKVLAPEGLYFPVLPVRIDGKLYFPLCKECAIAHLNECSHSREERSFWGTWTTPEINKAIEKGYQILEIKEIWHFPETSSDLFTDYVNTFLRSKQESSNYPSWVVTQDDRARYIQSYFEHEGVRLRPEKIQTNPGLRAISKLCLNSLWGRFGMNTDRIESELIHDAKRFYDILNGDDHDVHDMHLISDEVVELVFQKKKEYERESPVTNIFLAIFTTSWARLELYSLLDRYKEQILYCDTDSIILVERHGDPSIELSDYLGGLTDEIAKDHGQEHFIQEFVCCGPKNYAYKVSDGTCVVKVKGFFLNYENSKELNMESMRRMVQNMNLNHVITLVNENKITREPITRRIVNKREEKKYQLVYDKRIIMNAGEYSLPFGYKWTPRDDSLAVNRGQITHENFDFSDVKLYSEHYIVPKDTLGELFPYTSGEAGKEDENDVDIDLMVTSESEESEDELTHEDIDFIADDDNHHFEDPSFYRALENQM